MIEFQKVHTKMRNDYIAAVSGCRPHGCEYSFANLRLWGKQNMAFKDGCVAFFSHFYGKSVYPYPLGPGNRKAVLDAVLRDAAERGIPCRFTGMNEEDVRELESFYPGVFEFRSARDMADYVYDINDLADLKGKKFQKKRNHVNQFRKCRPDAFLKELTSEDFPALEQFLDEWYARRMEKDPTEDFLLERTAIKRALRYYDALGMEGALLMDGSTILAMTMASPLSDTTYDVHFEKAAENADGAYAAINQEFAKYLRTKHPRLQFLDREDDMGLEGLRKAKLSYNPHHLEEKYWAHPKTDLTAEEEFDED